MQERRNSIANALELHLSCTKPSIYGPVSHHGVQLNGLLPVWHQASIWTNAELTLNVRGPSYLGLTRSISWLLMPWLLTSPGHQQPWYWLYIEYVGPYLTWGRILSTCVVSMWRNDKKCKYMFMFTLKNLACKGLMSILSRPDVLTHWDWVMHMRVIKLFHHCIR